MARRRASNGDCEDKPLAVEQRSVMSSFKTLPFVSFLCVVTMSNRKAEQNVTGEVQNDT